MGTNHTMETSNPPGQPTSNGVCAETWSRASTKNANIMSSVYPNSRPFDQQKVRATLLLLTLLFATTARAQFTNVTFAWDPVPAGPTYTNGTNIIYYAPTNYVAIVGTNSFGENLTTNSPVFAWLDAGTNLTATVTNLTVGSRYYAIVLAYWQGLWDIGAYQASPPFLSSQLTPEITFIAGQGTWNYNLSWLVRAPAAVLSAHRLY